MLAALLLAFTTTGGLVKEGNRALEKGDAKAAMEAYGQALERAPGSPEILFDTGLARAAGGDTGGAREAFLAALAGGGEGLRGPIEYNVGNTYFAEQNYASAAKAYRAALAANAADQDAKANLELTLRRMAEQEKQQQDQAQQDQSQQDQQQGEDAKDQKQQPPQQDQPQADDQQSQEDNSAGGSQEPDQPQGQDQADSESPASDQARQQEQAQPPADDQHQEAQGGEAQPAGAAQMDPQQVDQLLDALQAQEEALQQQVRARLVPVAPRQLEQDW